MAYTKIAIFAFLFAWSCPSFSFAQAFGVQMGAKLEDLDVAEDIGDFFYIIRPPRPVSGFASYAIFATPETGVCVVRGIGEDFERDGYGLNVRGRFGELRGLLDDNYGEGNLQSGLRPGALWDEVDEWVMAIRQNERYHQAEWQVADKNGIEDIILSVEATASDSAWIALQYRFSNKEQCDAEAKAEDAGGL